MKKTLLVAALATGFAGVAHAESSVTLYGLVDAGLGYNQTKISSDGESVKTREIGAVTNVKNGSRWGLKGSEDLGNGTSAIFQLESGFEPASGNSAQGGRLFGRKAIIGLTGESWGTFTIGRQYNVADDVVAGIDPFGTAWGNAAATSTFGDSLSARQSPTFKYLSPSFDGFKFGVSAGYADTKTKEDGVTTAKKRSTLVSVGLGYNNGPVELGASFDYDNQKDGDVSTRKAKAWTVAGAYDFDAVKVHLGYGQQRDGMVGGNFGLADGLANSYYAEPVLDVNGNVVLNNDGSERMRFVGDSRGLRAQAWFGGISAPVGESGKVIAGYQGGRIKHKGFDAARINTHVWSLGYQHNLSKRTHVYVLGSYGQSKLKVNGEPTVKARATQAVVGLQHRF